MKHSTGWFWLLMVMFALLASCRTPLALVDDTYGFEHISDDHAVRLASLRMVLSPRAGSTSDAPRQQHDFTLSLRFVNDGSTPWQVASRGFSATVNACDGEKCDDIAVAIAQLPDPIAVVPPGQEVVYELPLTTTTGPGERRLEKFTIDLAYSEGDQQLLSRRLLLGEFNQGWQIVRLLGTITTGILAAFLL